MRRGDILLVNYKRDPVSWLIKLFIKGKYNHVAWVVSDYTVFEVRAKGVHFGNISRYRNKKLYGVKVLRIPTLSTKDYMVVLTFLVNNVKKHNIVDYFALIFSLMTKTSIEGLYTCSGLIATALSKIGYYFDTIEIPCFTTPTDIEKSKELIDVTQEF